MNAATRAKLREIQTLAAGLGLTRFADWNEEDHPRGAPGNAGQFIPAGGGGGGGGDNGDKGDKGGGRADREAPDRPHHHDPDLDKAFAAGFRVGNGPHGVSDTYHAQHAKVSAIYDNDQAYEAARQVYDTSLTMQKNGAWDPKRAELHEKILKDFFEENAGVPAGRELIAAGGLGGAGKTTILKKEADALGITTDARGAVNSHIIINADDFKERLFHAGAIPKVPGWTPAEASTFIHEEASQLADRASALAVSQGRNTVLDFTMAKEKSIQTRVDAYAAQNYATKALFVDVSIDHARSAAEKRHQHGYEDFVKDGGTSFGGRYVPEQNYTRAKAPTGSGRRSVNRENFDRWHHKNPNTKSMIVDNEGYQGKIVHDNIRPKKTAARAGTPFRPAVQGTAFDRAEMRRLAALLAD